MRFTALVLCLLCAQSVAQAQIDWNISGDGVLTTDVVDSDTTILSYSLNPRPDFNERSWMVSGTASAAGDYIVDWGYSGFHSFFAVTASLEATEPSGMTTLYSGGPSNCCTTPSAGFDESGQYTFSGIQAGETIGFIMGGDNFDSNNQLNGDLTLTTTFVPGEPVMPSSTGDFRIDIDSTQGGTPVRTEDGFTSLLVNDSGVGSVTVDGVTFETFSVDGARNRTGVASDLTADFVFDDGAGQAVGVTVTDLPPGVWKAEVYSFDGPFPAGDQIIGITQFAAGPELIFTDSFPSNETEPFTFVFDSSELPNGFGIFARENNSADRSRFNALVLTLVPEPTALMLLTGLTGVPCVRRWRARLA